MRASITSLSSSGTISITSRPGVKTPPMVCTYRRCTVPRMGERISACKTLSAKPSSAFINASNLLEEGLADKVLQADILCLLSLLRPLLTHLTCWKSLLTVHASGWLKLALLHVFCSLLL